MSNCTIDELRYMEDVTVYRDVLLDGEPNAETYTTDGDFVGYHCEECEEDFDDFDTAKSHFGEGDDE